ncbi:MAG: AAA-associated domain-containing protein [Candidatus Eisenbacteria bacterium]|nr:AAA-associated domain-containing protein [Candidatus Eisenbacteria bacterium]
MTIDPIPRVAIGKIIGLLEVIDDAGGRYDVFRLTRDINYEFGEILQVIKAAEMLDLVVTPGADVVLTGNGSALLRAKVNARKKLLKEQIRRLPLFKTVLDVLQKSEDRRADEDAFLDIFALHLPAEDSEALLKTVIDWGRYTELIGYNPDDQQLYLDQAD